MLPILLRGTGQFFIQRYKLSGTGDTRLWPLHLLCSDVPGRRPVYKRSSALIVSSCITLVSSCISLALTPGGHLCRSHARLFPRGLLLYVETLMTSMKVSAAFSVYSTQFVNCSTQITNYERNSSNDTKLILTSFLPKVPCIAPMFH